MEIITLTIIFRLVNVSDISLIKWRSFKKTKKLKEETKKPENLEELKSKPEDKVLAYNIIHVNEEDNYNNIRIRDQEVVD